MTLRNIFFFIILFTSQLLPQELKDSDFKLALDYLNAYQYENALKEFTRISEDVNHSNHTAALFFRGKIEFMLNKNQDAVKTFESLYKNYPSSKYIDEARIVTAKYLLNSGKYFNAFNELLQIIKNTASQEYINAAKITGKKIAAMYLSFENLDTLLVNYKGSKSAPFILMCAANKYLTEGQIKKADSLYQYIIVNFPGSEENIEALTGRKESSSQESIIAALLPLTETGAENESAKEILAGIKFAVDEYNETASYKAGLLIKDTGRDSARIYKLKNIFVRQQNLKAILGPVYSDEVRYALESLKESGIPVISPTATDNELTKKYSSFIQANSSFSFRGKIIAQYIYFVENKRRMAVLSPSAGYAYQLSASFKTEFKKLGGKIIADEVYKSGSYEVSKQASNIAAKKKDIEGIYLPLMEKSDAAVILSQLENSGVDVNLYGNQDWINAKGFQSSSNLSNKLIFSSDYFIDYNDFIYQEFNRKFREKTGLEAGRNALYGYDAAKALLIAIEGEGTRESIMSRLTSGQVFEGYHNNLSFDSNRMNKVLNIVRYKDGVFELIDRFKAGR